MGRYYNGDIEGLIMMILTCNSSDSSWINLVDDVWRI
jgi:hypothetical protein